MAGLPWHSVPDKKKGCSKVVFDHCVYETVKFSVLQSSGNRNLINL